MVSFDCLLLPLLFEQRCVRDVMMMNDEKRSDVAARDHPYHRGLDSTGEERS